MRRVRQDLRGKEIPLAASEKHPDKSSCSELFRHDLVCLQWYPCPATVSNNGDSFERTSEGPVARSVLPSTVQPFARVRGSSAEYGLNCHICPSRCCDLQPKERKSAGKAVLGLPWQKYGCGLAVSISLPRRKQKGKA